MLAGSDRFWALRKQALDDSVRRLSANGAVVVLMATEPPGVNLAPSDWAQFQIDHYRDITARWDNMLRAYGKTHPATHSSSMSGRSLPGRHRTVRRHGRRRPCPPRRTALRTAGVEHPVAHDHRRARAGRRDGRSHAALNLPPERSASRPPWYSCWRCFPFLGERTAAANACGPYRWPVQTLSDPARKHVASHPTLTSVRTLRSKAAPVRGRHVATAAADRDGNVECPRASSRPAATRTATCARSSFLATTCARR